MTDIEAALSKLFSSYPNTAISEVTVATYLESLCDIPPQEFTVVVRQCLRECKFLPTIAEIHERWTAITVRASELSATDAWEMVQREIRRVGSWGKPEFADSLVAKVVGAMGWMELCQSENVVADRAHFLKMYAELLTRQGETQRLLPEAREMMDKHRGLTHISAYLPKPKVTEDN